MNLNDILVSMNSFKEILKFTFIALIIVIPVRTYIAQPFIVSGPSMNPTFGDRQYLIVDEISYRFEDPSRGDVIVFKYPGNPKLYYIKRIIGLPNETVSVKSGKVTILNKENPEGIELDDSYVAEGHHTSETFEIKLGADEYFVMGDNRNESSDSRMWGNLNRKFIVGRPFLRLLPLSKISIFPGKE
jgi:signal peptidase I